METASLIITMARWWLYIGAVVAVLFLTVGIDRIDKNARGSYTFRPLLVPGILLLWPLVLWRWMRLEARGDHWSLHYRPLRAAHAPVWFALAILIPTILLGALVIRKPWPAGVEPRQISNVAR